MNKEEIDKEKKEENKRKMETTNLIRASYIARDLGYDGKEVTGDLVDWLHRIGTCAHTVKQDRKDLRKYKKIVHTLVPFTVATVFVCLVLIFKILNGI